MTTDGQTTIPGRRPVARKVLEELGLVSLYHSTADVKLLCAQRFVRLFAYGASTLVLVSFLRGLDISPTRIGLFMTLTLAGDVAISLVLSLFADGVGRRTILALGAILMIGSGVVFALCSNYWVLLLAAVLGVVSPSGNEVGPFRAVEESVIAHLTHADKRSDVYAWYSLFGNMGTAFGMVTSGWVIRRLSEIPGWESVDAYRFVFYLYAAVGLVKAVFVFLLSPAVEAETEPMADSNSGRRAETPTASDGEGEDRPLLQRDNTSESSHKPAPKRSWLPSVSKQSISIASTLCLLFALDSFGSGIAPLSWITYFFKSRYQLDEGRLGTIFFVTSIISAASMIVASSLAKRFGNIKTMVFTHLPSTIFLALIPIPDEVHGSLVFLVLRACTQSMDVAPRSAFLAAILHPQERTAVMGLVNVTKTVSQSLGPLITGLLADANVLWLSFICAGALKACYDLGLLALFRNYQRERTEQDHEDGNGAGS